MIFRAMMLKPSYEIPMDSAIQLIQENKVENFVFIIKIQNLLLVLNLSSQMKFLGANFEPQA